MFESLKGLSVNYLLSGYSHFFIARIAFDLQLIYINLNIVKQI